MTRLKESANIEACVVIMSFVAWHFYSLLFQHELKIFNFPLSILLDLYVAYASGFVLPTPPFSYGL